MRISKAVRKQNPEITVIEVTEDNLKKLIENNILNEHGNAVNSNRSQNPAKVNIGDYLVIDDMQNVNLINKEYFNQNFRLLREEDANIGERQS